jgi:hypothetical protein
MTTRLVSRPLFRDLAPALLIVALALLFFHKVILGDEVAITDSYARYYPWRSASPDSIIARPAWNTDNIEAYYPRRAFATKRIGERDIPLWEPWTAGGTPFFADPQAALFYPPNWPLFLGDAARGMGRFLFAHYAWAGLGAFLFFRRIGASRAGALVAAVAFMWNGFFVTRTGHPTVVASSSWLPWALLALERFWARPSAARAILLALTLAMSLLAGFPQAFLFAAYLVACLAASRWVAARFSREHEGRAEVPARAAIVVLLFAFGFAAVQLFPTAELIGQSSREHWDYATLLSSSHHPVMAIRAILPEYFGSPLDGTLRTGDYSRGNGYFAQSYIGTQIYAGLLPLVLAIAGVVLRRRAPSRWRRRFGWIAVVSLLLVYGTPLLRVYRLLPGLDVSRVDRVVVLYFLAVAGLASLGLTEISRRVSARLAGGPPARARVAAALLAVCALILVTIDLFPYGMRYNVSQPRAALPWDYWEVHYLDEDLDRSARAGDAATAIYPGNVAAPLSIPLIEGMNDLPLLRWQELLEAIEPGIYSRRRLGPLRRPESLRSPLLDLLGVRRLLTLAPRHTGQPGIKIIERPGFLPRVFVVPRYEIAGDRGTRLARLGEPDFDPRAAAILEKEPRGWVSGEGVATIHEYRAERVAIVVEGSGGGLILADNWYPGWKAAIDGTPAEILVADHALRFVALPAGRHTVVFEFHPRTLALGAAISLVTALVSAVIGIRAVSSARRRPLRAEPQGSASSPR